MQHHNYFSGRWRSFIVAIGVLVLAPVTVWSQDISTGQIASLLLNNATASADGAVAALLTSAVQKLMAVQGSNITLDDAEMLYHGVEESARITHRYTVKLKNSVDPQLAERIWSLLDLINGVSISHRFKTIFNGCVLVVPGELPLNLLRLIPWIEYIQEDSIWTIEQVQSITGSNANWGLDRIDGPTLPMDRSYTFSLTGKGVNVYIIDTGVDVNHMEFQDAFGQSRAKTVYVSPELSAAGACPEHGTHVAGVVGGTNVGVAKEANLFSLRVIGCDDNAGNAAVSMAIEWVIENHVKPAVINMSLGPKAGTGLNPSIDSAVASAYAAGITVVVAAGNGVNVPGSSSKVGVDACSTSPAGSRGAITVGATDIFDQRASFSNYGSCLALFAPGVDIVSARNGTRTGYLLKSGTSQATPFVSGVAALQYQQDPTTTPDGMLVALRAAASQNVVRDAKNSLASLLQSVHIPVKGSDEANKNLVSLIIYDKAGLTPVQIAGCIVAGFALIAVVGVSIFVWRRMKARKQFAASRTRRSATKPPPMQQIDSRRAAHIATPFGQPPRTAAPPPLRSLQTNAPRNISAREGRLENSPMSAKPRLVKIMPQPMSQQPLRPAIPPPSTPATRPGRPNMAVDDRLRRMANQGLVPRPMGSPSPARPAPLVATRQHQQLKVATQQVLLPPSPKPAYVPSPYAQKVAAKYSFDLLDPDQAYKTIEPLSADDDDVYPAVSPDNSNSTLGRKRGWHDRHL